MAEVINTLEIFNRFEKASFTREQAQELSNVLSEITEKQSATKHALKALETNLMIKRYIIVALIIAAVGLMIKFL